MRVDNWERPIKLKGVVEEGVIHFQVLRELSDKPFAVICPVLAHKKMIVDQPSDIVICEQSLSLDSPFGTQSALDERTSNSFEESGVGDRLGV